MKITIEVSPGELIDKLTILEIKAVRIADADKRANVARERAILSRAAAPLFDAHPDLAPLQADLKRVNEALWEIEDKIRACEAAGDFGPDFIELARAVYFRNDRRAAVKRAINDLLGSTIIEEKSYDHYGGEA